jgi:hypothetical protein
MTSLDVCPVFAHDFLKTGKRLRASRKVPITFVAIVISVPSAASYVFLNTPALASTTSSLSKELHLRAKALTES